MKAISSDDSDSLSTPWPYKAMSMSVTRTDKSVRTPENTFTVKRLFDSKNLQNTCNKNTKYAQKA